MYKYETHCHCAVGSRCGKLSPEELVEVYVKNGYAGIFVTDHFINGNCCATAAHPDASYEELMHYYCESYRAVKEAAGDRLQVFFGLEYSYLGTDILVYGWDENELISRPEIMKIKTSEFCTYARENGALTVQAHPFREDFYIDHIRLFPGAEGVEVLNTGRNERCNDLAKYYADAYGKVVQTGGSDLHWAGHKRLSGMGFETPLRDVADFIARLRAGEGVILDETNVLAK